MGCFIYQTTGRLHRLAVIRVWVFLQLDPLTGYALQGPFKVVPAEQLGIA